MDIPAALNAAKGMKSAKVLVIDIERRAGLAHIFDQRTSGFVHVDRWTRLPSLLCFAAEWIGHKPEFHAAWDDHAAMVRRSWELYDEAEIVVTYNGIKFDNKHLRSEWLLAGYPPPSPWKDLDLYATNRTLFGFESKGLNHLCQRLGLETKSGHYDPNLADQCMDGDEKAQKLMRRYNVGDVKITRQAYFRLRPWMHNHPHALAGPADDRPRCNVCWGDNLKANGTRLAQQITYTLSRCGDCGANVQGTRHSRAGVTRGVR